MGRFRLKIEQIVIQLKGAATEQLVEDGIHPLVHIKLPTAGIQNFRPRPMHPFLDTIEDIHRAIQYVENNPEKEGKPKQTWSFVTKFDPKFIDAIQHVR